MNLFGSWLSSARDLGETSGCDSHGLEWDGGHRILRWQVSPARTPRRNSHCASTDSALSRRATGVGIGP